MVSTLLRTGGVGAVLLHYDFGVSANDHQQIIEVVSDAARETTHRFHLLRLPNLFFQHTPAGDVARSYHDAAHGNVVEQIVAHRLQPEPGAIFAAKAIFRRSGASHLKRDSFQRRAHRRLVLGMNECEQTLSQEFRRLVSGHALD